MIYQNPKTFEMKIGNDTFLFVNDRITQSALANMKKLTNWLNKNQIDFEYNTDDHFEYGFEIYIRSREIYTIRALDEKDSFFICYTLEDGKGCDWEPSYRQLIDYIKRYPNCSARK
jgi:hypothetical protein